MKYHTSKEEACDLETFVNIDNHLSVAIPLNERIYLVKL